MYFIIVFYQHIEKKIQKKQMQENKYDKIFIC